MTTQDIYSYLSNEEFLRVHGDRIPEDLLPRVESLLGSVSEDEYIDLEGRCEVLEEENKRLEDEASETYDEIETLSRDVKTLELEIEKLQEQLDEIKEP